MRRLGRLLCLGVLGIATVIVVVEHTRATEERLRAETSRDRIRAWLAWATSALD